MALEGNLEPRQRRFWDSENALGHRAHSLGVIIREMTWFGHLLFTFCCSISIFHSLSAARLRIHVTNRSL